MGTIDRLGNIHNARGEFAGKVNSRPVASLAATTAANFESFLKARAELVAAGYAPADASAPFATDPRSSAGRESWWEEARLRSEYPGESTTGYPLMTDDNSPSMGSGQAISGHRHTYRVRYEGGGTSIRMPSKAAIDRFSADLGNSTFDVPVEAVGPAGNPIAGHIRVTQERPGVWNAQPLGFPEQIGHSVAAGVTAILESKRPRMALSDAGDLAAAWREQQARRGVEIDRAPGRSAFITGLGYSQDDQTAIVRIRDRVYGYRVPPATMARLASSRSVGHAYNELLRFDERVERVGIASCEDCGRVYAQVRGHSCGTTRRLVADVRPRYTEAVKTRLERLAFGYLEEAAR